MANELKPTTVYDWGYGNGHLYYENLENGILTIEKKDLAKTIFINFCNNVIIPENVKEVSIVSSQNISMPDTVTETTINNATIKKWSKNISHVRLISTNNYDLPDSVRSIDLHYSSVRHYPKSLKEINSIEGLNDFEFPECVVNNSISIFNSTIKIWPKNINSLNDIRACSNFNIPISIISIKWIGSCINLDIPSSVKNIGTIHTGGIDLKKGTCSVKIRSSSTMIDEINGEYGTLQVTIESVTPPVLGKAVNLSTDDTLIVPVGAKETYAKDPKWGKFKNIREDASLCGGKAEQKPAKETNKIEELEKRIVELEKIVAQLQKKIK